ncbi:MAG: cell division protein ZapA [Saprospiraceae bacterium]|nr:cell division protein ZapA [Saprospiraceae bacterium]
MITDTKKHINLVIAGRSYPVQVLPSEEEALHQVVAEVNRRVESFQSRHPGQDKQDLLAMAMLTFATELHQIQNSGDWAVVQDTLSQRIAQVDQLLGALLD